MVGGGARGSEAMDMLGSLRSDQWSYSTLAIVQPAAVNLIIYGTGDHYTGEQLIIQERQSSLG